MCGIVGICGKFTARRGLEIVADMMAQIVHRGPDSKGSWAQDGFAFGMQRLSIIDIEGGDQPISDKSGVSIICNGEIYNYRQLRVDLESTGHKFSTNSDTETILRLYLAHGIKAIEQLEGMFAIAIHDPRKRKLFLVRDRIGIKPLYYRTGKTFAFASEIKALFPALKQKPPLNLTSLSHYLTFAHVPSPSTIWQGIKKLEPGHFLCLDTENLVLHKQCYWSLPRPTKKSKKQRNCHAEFEVLFLEAVEKRLLASDVPVGIMLSGGLDSSCLAAAACELGHKNFHSFTVGFADGGEFSELSYARLLAKHVESNHHEIIIGKREFVAFLDEFVWHTDEPLADLASVPLYYVSKMASRYVKVALSGEGADEILMGYIVDKLASDLIKVKVVSKLPNMITRNLPHKKIRRLAREGYENYYRKRLPYMTKNILDDEKRALCRFVADISSDQLLEKKFHEAPYSEPLEQFFHVLCQDWLVEDLLMKADKMSMAASLEIRVPFLDHKLVEWAAELPMEYKVGSWRSGFTTKRILRDFAKKRLPREIINRPKRGFPVPAYEWLSQGKCQSFTDLLWSKRIDQYFNREAIEPMLERTISGDQKQARNIATLLILSKWLERWNPAYADG